MNFTLYKQRYFPLFLLAAGMIFYLPFLGYLHLFDWDEINFAESSREMLLSGDYFHVQVNYMPFWEKPPLFMWLQSGSMALFGINEFAARFPNAVFGIITLLTLYFIGKKHWNSHFGFIWALTYFMSFLPHIYFKSGIIDPVFNYFIFMSVYFLVCNINEKKPEYAWYSGAFAGLAILTKGPVGLLLVLLTYIVYQGVTRFRQPGKILHILFFTIAASAVTFIWVLPEVMKNGMGTLIDFFHYQVRLLTTGDAGHEQPFFYHFVVVFVGCFPMSIFAFPLFRARKFATHLNFTQWMMILFWVVMVLFTIVKTKIVHYSSMCWLPLSFCAAYYLTRLMENPGTRKKSAYVFLGGGLLFSLILTLVPLLGYYRAQLIPYIKDKFAVACMQLEVDWHPWLAVWGILFAAGIIIGFSMLRKNRIPQFIMWQSILTGVTLFAFLLTVVPKIEQHSQRPAIDFYREMEGKSVYVWPLGFKSYAHWYYFKVPQNNNNLRENETYLLDGEIDRPVYFVTKANNDFLDTNRPHFKFLGQKGGFKFYLREVEPGH